MQITARSLNSELRSVRDKFANPHQAIVEKRSDLQKETHELYERQSDLEGYRENLALYKPAVATLGQVVAQGRLEDVRSAALESASHASGNVFGSLALSTLKGLDSFVGGAGSADTDWETAGVVRLAENLGSDPAQHGAELDQTLGRELFITDSRRQELHPEAFIAGDLTGAKLADLSQWMGAEDQKVAQQLESLGHDYQSASQTLEATQDELQSHWRSRNVGFGERVEAARTFLSHLDEAATANPEVLKQMKAEGADSFVSLPGVLTSYRAQVKRHAADGGDLDWRKLLGQLERTSLG